MPTAQGSSLERRQFHASEGAHAREPNARRNRIMNIVRWNPRFGGGPRELITFQDDVNRLFDGFFGTLQQAGEGAILAPPTDLEETPEEFVVRVDLPGVSQKDVKVSLMGDTLTVRGSR